MGTPFMSEVKIISWNFAPQGWAFCNGQFLPINQNQALFSLLGTTYGGNGQTTFALPELRGRTPLHQGSGFIEGQNGGQEAHTLTLSEMPAHNHFVNASSTQGDVNTIQDHILAREVGVQYGAFSSVTTLNAASVSNYGGSQPHENRQPYLVLNFVIALQGAFPSQN
jgi:microcystin-dependent protein